MQRYIGIDVHSKSCTVAVVDGAGQHVGQHVVEANGAVPFVPPFLPVHPSDPEAG